MKSRVIFAQSLVKYSTSNNSTSKQITSDELREYLTKEKKIKDARIARKKQLTRAFCVPLAGGLTIGSLGLCMGVATEQIAIIMSFGFLLPTIPAISTVITSIITFSNITRFYTPRYYELLQKYEANQIEIEVVRLTNNKN